MNKPMSVARVRALLQLDRADRARLVFDGVPIGRVVRYGVVTKTLGRATRFGSRVARGSVRIEAEAKTVPALLNKVAAEIAAAMRAGHWPVAPAVEAPEPYETPVCNA